MIIARCILTLLGITAIQSTGRANVLEANDEQTCIDLCNKCYGVATFDDSLCGCHVADDNQRGAECIDRIKRQAGQLGLDIVSCDLADPDADRAARCVVTPFRRFRTQSDADLIAKYFMGGLGGLNGLLGSSKSTTKGKTSGPEESDSSSTAENDGVESQGNGNKLDSGSGIVGASDPMSSPMMGGNPLLGTVAAWLNPQTLLAIGNGMQGVEPYGFVGQPDPSSMSSSTNQYSELDSTQKNLDTGNSASMGMQQVYGAYPTETVVGMAPYSYFVGAPNPVVSSSQVPVQPYWYTYNSMLGVQNPYRQYPMPQVGMNQAEPTALTAGLESSMDESAKVAEELPKESNSGQSLEAEKSTDLQDKTDESEANGEVVEELRVGSTQTDQSLNEDAVSSTAVKLQARDPSSYSIKRRHSKLKQKIGSGKSEDMIDNLNPETTSGAD